MIARIHHDNETLDRLRLDRLRDDEHDIIEHVETCRACQEQLETLSQSGMTWDEVGELLRPSYTLPSAKSFKCLDVEDSNTLTTFAASFLDSSDHPESLGRFARYEIMEVLGRGGMGIVMRGFDTSLNRHSAIKVLAPELATSAAARKRFSREAKSAAAVVHPHVVPIQTVDDHNGIPYLVMPVVEGQSLQQRVERDGPVSVIEAVRIASQVADGLNAAHQQGLVHRDIKPANVLLENSIERVQITDFGLARAIDDASMTRSGVIAGTPQYMSPEQAHGDKIDHRSDLFSLGSSIYFMLAGRSPFRAETTMGVLNRIGNDEPRSIRSINADVPQWLEQIVMKLLSKSPDGRYQTSAELADLLQDWYAHLQHPDMAKRPSKPVALAAISCPAPTPAAGSRGWMTRWLIATAAFSFLALAGVLIVLELSKGTLRIESEADDVPIRILKGDEVVKRLTVSQSGDAIRIAAGEYLVEVDHPFDEAIVSGGSVSLKRGDTETVTITLLPVVAKRDAKTGYRSGDPSSADKIAKAINGLRHLWIAEWINVENKGDVARLEIVEKNGSLFVRGLVERDPTDRDWQGEVPLIVNNFDLEANATWHLGDAMKFAHQKVFKLTGDTLTVELPDKGFGRPRPSSASVLRRQPQTPLPSASDTLSRSPLASLLHDVAFDIGEVQANGGNQIEIHSVASSGIGFEIGATVTVSGVYTLESAESADLCFFSTTTLKSGEKPTPTPIQSDQRMKVSRGTRAFQLSKVIRQQGSPHVAFYHHITGEAIGGVYFSERETVTASGKSDQPSTMGGSKSKSKITTP